MGWLYFEYLTVTVPREDFDTLSTGNEYAPG